MRWLRGIIQALVFVFLFFHSFLLQNEPLHEINSALIHWHWLLLFCLSVWCICLLVITFSWKDCFLIGFLCIGIIAQISGFQKLWLTTDIFYLLISVIFSRMIVAIERKSYSDNVNIPRAIPFSLSYMTTMIFVLVLASCLHPVHSVGDYMGPRWCGIWGNPNTYGALMGVGVVISIGLLIAKRYMVRWARHVKIRSEEDRYNGRSMLAAMGVGKWRMTVCLLFVAVGMLSLGLVMSWSRGAWCGVAVGLLHMARNYGKLKWRYVALAVGFITLVLLICWGRTSDFEPWCIKRVDLSRPSVQHRISAWLAGLETIRDHPFGVGWNNAVRYCREHCIDLGEGAAAITTNDYLMIGVQLGITALLSFVIYLMICYRAVLSDRYIESYNWSRLRGKCFSFSSKYYVAPLLYHEKDDCLDPTYADIPNPLRLQLIRITCSSGAIVLLVAFFFDGGLFQMSTGSIFWPLLELSSLSLKDCGSNLIVKPNFGKSG